MDDSAENPVSAKPISHGSQSPRPTWRDYLELTKPKVVALMLVTSFVGMQLATPYGFVDPVVLIAGLVGIAFSAGAAAAINHSIDRRIDAKMTRTKLRPIVVGKIQPNQALSFAAILTGSSMLILFYWTNLLTAILTLATLVGYAYIYTGILKRLTSQNIVIGGLAGATPPLLGWTAVTGQVEALPLLLVLIIFTWTPPHFWALAVHRHKEYARSGLPMLPVTHGIEYTKTCILLYTILLTVVTLLPYFTHQLGHFYAVGALVLNLLFLGMSARLKWFEKPFRAIQTFHFSNVYLLLLFVFMLGDHYA